MLNPISTLSALCKRQRLPLGFGLVLALVLVLIKNLMATVDITDWTSGFIHPLHGADHLLAMLAVGIWAAQLRGNAIWLLPTTFVGVMSLGGLAGAAGIILPGAEAIVLLSSLILIGLITRKIRFSSHTNVLIVAFFAFFHGFAHGQEISTSASLISYTLGFMVATLLLHGAGILVVRLIIVIFALFLSQIIYAQPASNNSSTKLTALAETQHANGHISPNTLATSNSAYNRQVLFSEGESLVDISATKQYQAIIASMPDPDRELSGNIFHVSKALVNKPTITNLLVNHQTGTHFLAGGVGVTSPPTVLLVNNTPRFYSPAVLFIPIPVYNNSSSLEAIRYLNLPQSFYLLATSFLTNGVGATSPPVFSTYLIVTTHNSNELAFCKSPLLKAPIALHPSISRALYFSNPLILQTQLTSSLYSFYLPIRIARQRWPSQFINRLNIINNNKIEEMHEITKTKFNA